MFFVLNLVPVVMIGFLIYQYWRSLTNLGFASEVIRGLPNMLPLDAVAVLLGLMVAYWGLHSGTGFMLTFLQSQPLSEVACQAMAMLCCFGSMAICFVNSGDRFTTPTVAGVREAAVRTVVTLRILDSAEAVVREAESRRGRRL